VTLNRPDRFNAMTVAMFNELESVARAVGDDRDVRAVILTGAGKAFCAGYDLDEAEELASLSALGMLDRQELAARALSAIRAVPVPVIAAVNGPAAGFGLALCLASDIRYASREAVFRAAFINVGVSNCDMGTSWLLPRLIGASRAHELMLTGRRLGAEEALRIGLVAELTDGEALPQRAVEGARQIASLSPWGVRLTKQGMWTALELPSEQSAVEYEDRQQIMSTFGQAPAEAVDAFLQKRDAEFAD